MGKTKLSVCAIWIMMCAIPTNDGAPVLERSLNNASVASAFPLVRRAAEAPASSGITSARSGFGGGIQFSNAQTVFKPNILDLPDGVLASALVGSMLAAFLAIRLSVALKSSR
jgi:hypothetical protein